MADVAESVVPSPKSQAYVVTVPSLSAEALASKVHTR